MKYLLSYLEGLPDAPKLEAPGFQQLLNDVQAGKSLARSTEAFYESLEKIVNELKSSPESAAFQKPVSKRDAPDYHLFISKPMDLSTVLRNVKQRKYKSKADFAADLDLIWENCHLYNTQETHPLRAAARFMQQKTNHHLEFLVDKIPERSDRAPVARVISRTSFNTQSPSISGPIITSIPASPSPADKGEGDDDAAGESDDGAEGSATRKAKTSSAGPADGTADHVIAVAGPSMESPQIDGNSVQAASSKSAPALRHNLQTSFDQASALVRTPYSMTRFSAVNLSQSGPSFSDKGKAKEIFHNISPPPWYTSLADDEEDRLEGQWWTSLTKDEAYTAGLPTVPTMSTGAGIRRKRISRNGHKPITNGIIQHPSPNATQLPSLIHSKSKSLEKIIHKTVEQLHETRRLEVKVQEWQRIDAEGGIQPPFDVRDAVTDEKEARAKEERKRKRIEEREKVRKRRKTGGEVGEEEAAKEMKKASAGLLAMAGFEGANEAALDMFTRVAIDNLTNLGRTFRVLMDYYAQQMTPEEIVLHALNENGQVRHDQLEGYIKEGIEKQSTKIAELARKTRLACAEVASGPIIEDDTYFIENAEMLVGGDFADEFGEDFLGQRDLGIDNAHGIATLSVPLSLFYGRQKRSAHLAGSKTNGLEYPPPPPFIPLNQSTYLTHLPGMLHSFFSARLGTEKGLQDDEAFDPGHAQIGSLGQIVSKVVIPVVPKKREKRDADGEGKKLSVKKVSQPGVGKGNWIRPPKEERQRKAAEKKAFLEAREAGQKLGLGVDPPIPVNPVGEEDAEGEEE